MLDTRPFISTEVDLGEIIALPSNLRPVMSQRSTTRGSNLLRISVTSHAPPPTPTLSSARTPSISIFVAELLV